MTTRNVAECDLCKTEIRLADGESPVIRIGYRDMRPEDFWRFDVCLVCLEGRNVAAELFKAEHEDRVRTGDGQFR